MILDLKRDGQLLSNLYLEYQKNLSIYRKIDNYYNGKSDAKQEYEITDRSNRKASINFFKKFIKEEVSFAVGSKTTYISKSNNAAAIKDIEYILDNINNEIDIDLCTCLDKYGTAYELSYLNNLEFKIKTITPIQGIAYENVEGEAEIFMYFYKQMLDNDEYVDIIDDRYIYRINASQRKIIEIIEHYFGKCPVGIAKFTYGVDDTLFSEIHELLDLYEMTLWDACNNIADLRSSYLAMYGIDVDEDETKKMKKNGILLIPDANGKVEWLTKNLDAESNKDLLDRLEGKIYEIAQHINHNVDLASNISGIALSSRLISLRNKIIILQNNLKSAIKMRIKCLFIYLKQVETKNYDYKDIVPKLVINMPTDDASTANIISQLSNSGLSVRTGLSQLSFVTDSDREFNNWLEEKKLINENDAALDDLDKVDDSDEDVDKDEVADEDE